MEGHLQIAPFTATAGSDRADQFCFSGRNGSSVTPPSEGPHQISISPAPADAYLSHLAASFR